MQAFIERAQKAHVALAGQQREYVNNPRISKTPLGMHVELTPGLELKGKLEIKKGLNPAKYWRSQLISEDEKHELFRKAFF